MNFVFISPHFPPQYYLFCSALKSMGVTVLGLGDGPPHELRSELRSALADYAYVPQLSRYDETYRAFAGLASRHGRLVRVDSLNEHWLELEAQLREDFNIPGPHLAEILRNRSKHGMKAVYRQAGIPVAEGELVTSTGQLRQFAGQHGFPFILKPDTGVGAAETFKVSDQHELDRALERPLKGYFAEAFMTGDLFSFDGLTDEDGRIVFCTAHRTNAGVMELATEKLDVLFCSLRTIPDELEQLGRKAVMAFGLRQRFFHAEFFRLADGTFRALEVNFRPPGGFTTDMMNYASDIDIYHLWARVMRGDSLEGWTYERRYHSAHVSRRNFRRYRIPHDELVALLGEHLMYWREMPRAFSGAMGDVVYLVRYPTMDALVAAAQLVHAAG